MDQSVVETVFAQLAEAIISGALAPGSKISEPQLAQRFGVSRAPLREAIRRLEGRRLVTSQPNRGARVIEKSLDALREYFDVRESLEGLAARNAALNATADQLSQLRACLVAHEAGLEATGRPSEAAVSASRNFHVVLVRAGGNRVVIDILCDQLYPLMRLYRGRNPAGEEQVREALRDHQRIYDAIEDRDAELAELLARRHVRRARDMLERSVAHQLQLAA